MPKARQVLFRIFYSTTFTIVFLILIAFICVSPVDTMIQSYRRSRLIDIFLITGVYVVTGIIAALIYASRLYTNRGVLKEIPKTYMPIDEGDLPTKRTWKFISETLARSAIIAYQAKPRSNKIEDEIPNAQARIAALLKPELGKEQDDVDFVQDWGVIEHRGWSSPASVDLPDLEYSTVVAELTDLIEARAVSLAPSDPLSTPAPDGTPVPDERVIELLTRPDNAGMRKYLTQLMELEMLPINELTTSFLILYERSRFGPEPLSETEFQSLMRMFAEILRSMKPVDIDLLDLDELSNDEIDDNDNSKTKGQIPTDQRSLTHSISTKSSIHSSADGSVRHLQPRPRPRRMSEDSVPSLATDDDDAQSIGITPTARSRTTTRRSSRNTATRRFLSSNNSNTSRPQISQRQRSAASLASTRTDRSRNSNPSSASASVSARSITSTGSRTGSVIIRLNDNDRPGTLPYTIELPDRRRSSASASI